MVEIAKELLEKQLRLLSERSENEEDNETLCNLTAQMANVATFLERQTRLDDEWLSFRTTATISLSDLVKSEYARAEEKLRSKYDLVPKEARSDPA